MAMHPLESSVHQALFDALRSQVETHLNDRILDYADGLANRDDFTKALDAVADKAYQQLEEELFGAPPPTPQFFDEYDFFLEFLAPAYGNTEAALTRVNWSDQWYNHEQELLRIHELWQRYELLRRTEPSTYVETFLRTYADYHMDRLMRPGGILDETSDTFADALPLPNLESETDSSNKDAW